MLTKVLILTQTNIFFAFLTIFSTLLAYIYAEWRYKNQKFKKSIATKQINYINRNDLALKVSFCSLTTLFYL